MHKGNVTQTSTGIGFIGLLTIVLVILKATGYIDWSWLWVFAPVWLGLICTGTILVFFTVIAMIVVLLQNGKGKYG